MNTVEKRVPIQLEDVYANTSLFLSIDVSVEQGSLMKLNVVNIEDNLLYNQSEEPKDLKVSKKGKDLKGKNLVVSSRYNVIVPTEGEPVHPKITWKPDLEAGDHTLYDTEETASSDDNMFEFRIIFEIR